MKKILSVGIILTTFFIVACSNEESEDNIPKEPQKTLADYEGVWEDVNNDTLFISISANGKIKYYCGKYIVGNGFCVLDKNIISISNEYSGLTDKFQITDTKDGLVVKCYSPDRLNSYATYYTVLHLKPANESTALFTGDLWAGDAWSGTLGGQGERTQYRISINSETSASHYKYSNKKGIVWEEGLYCIQRTYHNSKKFIYCHPSSESFSYFEIFSWDGEFIRYKGDRYW
nr:MAG TPA: protein of unknown function DUF4969 [Caudoviricetes sp.]